LSEFIDITRRQMGLLFDSPFDFRELAFAELRKYNRAHLVSLAKSMVTGVDAKNYRQWGRPGIRAQLLDIENGSLEMDFVFEGDEKSFHVLNAVSPGFTCSIPFSSYACDQIDERMNK